MPWKILKNFEHIKRSFIFISARDKMLYQEDISVSTIKELFDNMKILRKLSKKSNSLKK